MLPAKNEIQNDSLINWNRFSSSLIIETKRGDSTYTSSAVAIGRNMLLTAAHSVDCIDSGDVYLQDSGKSIRFKKSIIHPGYNPNKSFYLNDIAIIVLEHNLPNNIYIEELDNDIDFKTGEELQRIGFGLRSNQNLKTWTTPKFEGNTNQNLNLILKDFNSVIGDSGGPIYKKNNDKLNLVGIHSTLEGESKTYVVNILSYYSWINSNKTLKSV